MSEHHEIRLADGRIVATHQAGASSGDAPVLVMHYGTPHTGRHPARIAELAQGLGLRLLSVTRPGFPGSPRRLGRTVSETAEDVVEVLDRLEIDRVATAGYSGGGPHALALAALLRDRVQHAAAFASPAPYDGTPSWFTGMAGNGGGLRPAAGGREVREKHQRTAEFDPSSFTDADWAALSGAWAGIGEDAQAAGSLGSDEGEIDDDLAFVAPWGIELSDVTAEMVLFQGTADRIVPAHHVERLASLLPTATVRLVEGSGHVAVLDPLPDWMYAVAQG